MQGKGNIENIENTYESDWYAACIKQYVGNITIPKGPALRQELYLPGVSEMWEKMALMK